MTASLHLSGGRLRRADGHAFDAASHRWVAAERTEGPDMGAEAAVAWLLREGGGRRLPAAIIGPRDAPPEAEAAAEAVGAALARLGLPLICGGRGGVMEAASRGCARAGGLMIGLLPSDDWREANRHVAVPIATGIGEARNAVIATAGFAFVAVGGARDPVSYGTMSEMAFALRHGRLVLGLADAPALPGCVACATAEEAARRVAERYLALG
jgi:hypothetical protein